MQLTRIRELLEANQLAELSEEIEDLKDQLADVRIHYERVCASRGIELPYRRGTEIGQ
jgi:hypothetical protein